ncbi:MAG: hypothetical protein BWK76_27685 [Desulfobulbaceae bacterium A2]|nr:MAG: hypothetical protein BWK76_27685 [Desulfobulbaceae bacterium A2]
MRRRRSEDLFLATEPPRFTGDDTGPGGGGLHTGPTHWSIGWSDLMMTMCMLFLILYVQQTTQRNFLRDTGEEVVAGSEIELRHTPENAVPLAPISPQISDRPGDTLKRVEPERKTVQELDELLMQQPGPTKTAATPAAKSVVELADATTLAELDELRKTIRGGSQRPIEQLPRPLGAGHSATPGSLADIYTMSHHALAGESRHQQAMVELEPDKAVHIILTADLLFPAGSTELSEQARTVLRKVAGIIRNTPNQIHIEGHSDSQPPRARQSSTNLEVSLARASRVARVFIDEMGIQASRIVVAGHADNRPRQPNSDEVGRAANRRVELIISRESPPGTPEPPNPTTSG